MHYHLHYHHLLIFSLLTCLISQVVSTKMPGNLHKDTVSKNANSSRTTPTYQLNPTPVKILENIIRDIIKFKLMPCYRNFQFVFSPSSLIVRASS